MEQNKTGREVTEEQMPQACHHMTKSVNALAEDTLSGPMRWYTSFHVAVCPQCKAALNATREHIASEAQEHAGCSLTSPAAE